MTVLHTGSNTKFSANWANIFGKGKKTAEAKPAAAVKPAAKAKKKAAAKKPAKKKGKK